MAMDEAPAFKIEISRASVLVSDQHFEPAERVMVAADEPHILGIGELIQQTANSPGSLYGSPGPKSIRNDVEGVAYQHQGPILAKVQAGIPWPQVQITDGVHGNIVFFTV